MQVIANGENLFVATLGIDPEVQSFGSFESGSALDPNIDEFFITLPIDDFEAETV